MSKYTTQLRDKRAALLVRQGNLLAPGHTMTSADKAEFRDIQTSLEGIDTQLARAKNSKLDTRGDHLGRRGKTQQDRAFSNYLRTGETRGVTPVYDIRADGPGFSSAPNDSVVSAGP